MSIDDGRETPDVLTSRHRPRGSTFRSRHPFVFWGTLGAGALLVVIGAGLAAGGTSTTSSAVSGAGVGAVTGGTAKSKTVPSSAQAAAQSWGDGTYEVGVEIKPGKYKTKGGVDDGPCYWARMKSPNAIDIIDNGVSSGPQTVIIVKTDKYFDTNGCQEWVRVK